MAATGTQLQLAFTPADAHSASTFATFYCEKVDGTEPLNLVSEADGQRLSTGHFEHDQRVVRTQFPSSQKEAIIGPTLKKLTFDPTDLKSYRSISNLNVIQTYWNSIVINHFDAHANLFQLFPVHQSAYTVSLRWDWLLPLLVYTMTLFLQSTLDMCHLWCYLISALHLTLLIIVF